MRFGLVAVAYATFLERRGSPELTSKVEALDTKLEELEKSGSSAVAGEAKKLHTEAEEALKDNSTSRDEGLKHVLAGTKELGETLVARQQELGKEEEIDRLKAHAERLEKSVDAKTRAELEAAVTSGDADSLRTAMTDSVANLKDKIDNLNKEQAGLASEIETANVQSLLRLLRERKSLPLKTQMAVLKRDDYAHLDVAQELLNSTDTNTSLFDQLVKLKPEAEVPEEDIHHTKGAHSESRRVFVVSSKLKNAVKTLRAGLEKVRTQLQAAVESKEGDAAAVEQGKSILKALDGAFKTVDSTTDLKTQLDALDSFQEKLGGLKLPGMKNAQESAKSFFQVN